MTRELHALAKWLRAAQVTAVAMEATGVYWMPVWNVLEPYGFQLLLINPEHYKAVRGKKTDLKDGTRIAELLQDGRLEGSYGTGGDQRLELGGCGQHRPEQNSDKRQSLIHSTLSHCYSAILYANCRNLYAN